jgi:hypothetical protein
MANDALQVECSYLCQTAFQEGAALMAQTNWSWSCTLLAQLQMFNLKCIISCYGIAETSTARLWIMLSHGGTVPKQATSLYWIIVTYAPWLPCSVLMVRLKVFPQSTVYLAYWTSYISSSQLMLYGLQYWTCCKVTHRKQPVSNYRLVCLKCNKEITVQLYLRLMA